MKARVSWRTGRNGSTWGKLGKTTTTQNLFSKHLPFAPLRPIDQMRLHANPWEGLKEQLTVDLLATPPGSLCPQSVRSLSTDGTRRWILSGAGGIQPFCLASNRR